MTVLVYSLFGALFMLIFATIGKHKVNIARKTKEIEKEMNKKKFVSEKLDSEDNVREDSDPNFDQTPISK